jgi:uncharacterized membrane protein YphA (DoxX/SURF4 family)
MKEDNPVDARRSSKGKIMSLWSLQILLAAVFLISGFGKLSGQPMTVEMFDKMGVGQWFRCVTGSIEVISAILLLVPRLAPIGAALLVCTMCGAIITHLIRIGGSPMPALVLGCLAATVFCLRFGQVKASLLKPSPSNTTTNL